MTQASNTFSQEQLLGRPSPRLDLIGSLDQIEGHRILITGAAGSVGGPLAKQLAALHPSELILLDSHEHTLFKLRNELGAIPGVGLRSVLADVRDRKKIESVFRSARPDIVFHLAAYKHVPLGEENPDQTVEVNLRGIRSVIEASAEFGVGRFVYPSSDKAVNPPSIYGATKKLSELLTLAADAAFATDYSVSRYVNIVGTRGSVIETFTAQIAQGKPLTLTDPKMTRYWITMPEATRLLVQTALAPESGIVLMPDIQAPINLVEMARHMYSLLAPEAGAEAPIKIIGPRPGERTHEILLSDTETASETPFPGIVRVTTSRTDMPNYAQISSHVDGLLALAESGDLPALRERLLTLANSLQ